MNNLTIFIVVMVVVVFSLLKSNLIKIAINMKNQKLVSIVEIFVFLFARSVKHKYLNRNKNMFVLSSLHATL